MAEPESPSYPKIGDVVLLQKAIATVMYIGPVHWNNNTNAMYIGLELPEKITNGHNGTYDNMLYFKCKPKRGIILPIDTIIKIISPRELFDKLTTFKSKLKQATNENEKVKHQIPQIHSDDDDTKLFETAQDKKCNEINQYNVLKNEFDEIKKQYEQSKQKVDILSNQNKQISENQINTLTETLHTTENELKTKNKQIDTLLIQNKEMNDKLTEIISEKHSIEETNKNELNSLKETLQMRQNDIDTQSKDICIEMLTQEKNGLISEKNELKRVNNELLDKYNAIETENNALLIEKDEIEKIKKQLVNKYENELQIKNNENNDLLGVNKSYKNDIERLECKLKEYEQKLENIKTNNEKLIQEYKHKNNELNENIARIENELNGINEKYILEKNNFELMNYDLKTQNDELNCKLNDAKLMECKYNNEMEKIKEELVREKEIHNESVLEVRELNGTVEKLELDMVKVREELGVKYENDL
eukprot:542304_1